MGMYKLKKRFAIYFRAKADKLYTEQPYKFGIRFTIPEGSQDFTVVSRDSVILDVDKAQLIMDFNRTASFYPGDAIELKGSIDSQEYFFKRNRG